MKNKIINLTLLALAIGSSYQSYSMDFKSKINFNTNLKDLSLLALVKNKSELNNTSYNKIYQLPKDQERKTLFTFKALSDNNFDFYKALIKELKFISDSNIFIKQSLINFINKILISKETDNFNRIILSSLGGSFKLCFKNCNIYALTRVKDLAECKIPQIGLEQFNDFLSIKTKFDCAEILLIGLLRRP